MNEFTIPNSASMLTPTQREKLEQLENDRKRITSTRLDHIEPDTGGRFAELARRQGTTKSTIIGSDPAAQYPKLPETSPWHSDGVGLEPPLADNDMGSPIFPLALGEPHEAAKAAEILALRNAQQLEGLVDPADAPSALCISGVGGDSPRAASDPNPSNLSPGQRADGMPAPTPMGVPAATHDALQRLFSRRVQP
jgi:hypothetical protein